MKKYRILLLLTIIIFVSSCSAPASTTSLSRPVKTPVEEYEPTDDYVGKPYLILNTDTTLQQIMLRDFESGRQYLYSYNSMTNFYDKYGGFNSITSFLPGRACIIDNMDYGGLISEIRLSDKTWELDDVINYEIDTDREVFAIDGSNYHASFDTPVFSDGTQLSLSEIGLYDTLRVVGKDKEIWSVTVTTGHGMLSLTNTSYFDGSLICVGNIYTMINGEMELEVPEGTYNIVVANDGYGGSVNVDITRGGHVVVDLDSIKSQTLRYCKLTFNIEVPDAVIKIDGNTVASNQVLDIMYGRHLLSVTAPGYESWSKYLYVNSESATILLEMNEEGKSSNNNVRNNNSTTDNTTKKEDDDKEEDSADTKKETELEYLTTIRDTVSSIMGSLGT